MKLSDPKVKYFGCFIPEKELFKLANPRKATFNIA